MKEFEPRKDFVSRVMKDVYAFEQARQLKQSLSERLLASRPFRYAMSASGIFAGIFLIPAHCI